MKTKNKIFKLQNVVIIAFLSLLGFTSCQKEEKKCKCKCQTEWPKDPNIVIALYGTRPPVCTC